MRNDRVVPTHIGASRRSARGSAAPLLAFQHGLGVAAQRRTQAIEVFDELALGAKHSRDAQPFDLTVDGHVRVEPELPPSPLNRVPELTDECPRPPSGRCHRLREEGVLRQRDEGRVELVPASQIASASAASFLPRFT